MASRCAICTERKVLKESSKSAGPKRGMYTTCAWSSVMSLHVIMRWIRSGGGQLPEPGAAITLQHM